MKPTDDSTQRLSDRLTEAQERRRIAAANAPDRATWASAAAITATERRAVYVRLRDGVELAVDIYLPARRKPEERLPAVLTQTRYYRRFGLREGNEALDPFINPRSAEAQTFAAAGYAFVVVDVRGSGASTGFRLAENGPDERADGKEICDWIVAQPWSNGQIVTTGVSYEGTCAEHLLGTGHCALMGAAPRFSFFDAYEDFWAPGGMRPDWVAQIWGELVGALDSGRLDRLAPLAGDAWRIAIEACSGPAPVDADRDGNELRIAIDAHAANLDVPTWIRALEYRDDLLPDGRTIDALAPAARLGDLPALAIPIYSWSGWFDGAYAAAAIKRWRAHCARSPHPGHRLLLGPWDHGGRQLPSFRKQTPRLAGFNQPQELVHFFDTCLDRNKHEVSPSVRYYVLGANEWRSASDWPPPGTCLEEWYLASERTLAPAKPVDHGDDRYQVDFRATTGVSSRWRSWINIHGAMIGYPDREQADTLLLTYDSAPLLAPLEVTGNPVLVLWVTVDQPDTAFHVYLEEVRADGSVHHVTEGVLRGIHRHSVAKGLLQSYRRADAAPFQPGVAEEVTISLLPVAYRFAERSRIRLALAGADRDNFNRVPVAGPAPLWTVHRSLSRPSCLRLPLVGV